MKFKTKVDWWLGLIMGVSAVGYIWMILFFGDTVVSLYAILFAIVVVALCWPCFYILTEKTLLVRSGVIVWKVPYEKIYRVKPTCNALSSPAWSLARLAIHYGKKCVMVSPERQKEFMAELVRRTGLRQKGEELVVPD